MGAFASLE